MYSIYCIIAVVTVVIALKPCMCVCVCSGTSKIVPSFESFKFIFVRHRHLRLATFYIYIYIIYTHTLAMGVNTTQYPLAIAHSAIVNIDSYFSYIEYDFLFYFIHAYNFYVSNNWPSTNVTIFFEKH